MTVVHGEIYAMRDGDVQCPKGMVLVRGLASIDASMLNNVRATPANGARVQSGPGTRGHDLKVLIVAEHASAQFGGEAAIPAHLFRVMRTRGVDVRLITHSRTEAELRQSFARDVDRITFIQDTWLHILLWRLGRPLPTRLGYFTAGLLSRLYTQFLARREARRLIAEHGIDVLHQPIPVSPKEFSILSAMGCPVVIGPVNGGMTFPPAFRRRQSRFLDAFDALGRPLSNALNLLFRGKRNAAIVLAANERSRRALPACVRGDVRILVENGVDLQVWTSSAAVDPSSRRPGPVRFAYVGRLVDWKAVDLLLRAAKLTLGDAVISLSIIGDGVERPALEALAAELGIQRHIHFLGWKSQPDCADLLRDSDAFVLPSLCECGGAVVLEAMCVGLPVIATDWGGPADYLDDTCGILVKPKSRDEFIRGLASAMLRLVKDPSLRLRMGNAGRKKVIEQYDWERKVDFILATYADAVESHTPAAANFVANGK